MHTAAGVFDGAADKGQALDELVCAGFPKGSVSLQSHSEDEDESLFSSISQFLKKLHAPARALCSAHYHSRAVLALAAVLGAGHSLADDTGSGFTQQQAKLGTSVYGQHCAQCHGDHLQGGAAPALSGNKFDNSIENRFSTAGKLLEYVSRNMPVSNPGALSKEQYQDVVALILAQNGYKMADQQTDPASLDQVKLTPVPKSEQANGTQLEIQNIGSADRTVKGALPDVGRVNITDQMMHAAASDNANWLLHGRDYTNQRYSPLDQINQNNINSLVPVALTQTGLIGSFEATPIVVNGVMYLTTPTVDRKIKVLAMDAASGEVIWETSYSLGDSKICCGPVNRGVAVAYGSVYFVTLDDQLVSLNAATGEKNWSVQVADPSVGYSETMAPQVFNGRIIIGSAGGEWPIRGYLASYDASTGKQAWRFETTDPKTYEGDSWKHGGAMVWTTPAIDVQRKLIIFATGNPNPDLFGESRKGDNLYSDSIVALDADTGKLAWYHQEIKHDVWDYDAASNVVLFDVKQNGETIPAAGNAGKDGWFHIVDRRNGKLIRKSDPFVMQSKNMFSTPTKQGVEMLPGANGGAEWSPPAYSPHTGYVYVMGMNQLMNFTTQDPAYTEGSIRLGSAFTNVKKGSIQNGVFSAIDVNTGKIAWQYDAPQPLIGGALATGGDLVFMGEGNGYFDAFDAKGGKRLWRFNLGAGVNAPPVTYTVKGEQYIAVAAGGNFQLGFPYGDAVAIFKVKK
jgi:alcohol dehydrogenase (cytochrome c)